MRKIWFLGFTLMFLLFVLVGGAWADKAATSIEGPANAPKGSEVTIKITVTHSSNSALHHTEWLKVTGNNKEIGRWDFTGGKRPEAAVFTREMKVRITEDLEVKAEANCNVHGSKGSSTLKISVK